MIALACSVKQMLKNLFRLGKEKSYSLTCAVPIQKIQNAKLSPIDKYWGNYTVRSKPFQSAEESLAYLKWRASIYPLFEELMGLYGDHSGKTVLDYGCGPANDLIGFLIRSKAKEIIGIDISLMALQLASHRLSFHKEYDLSRIKLIQTTDTSRAIPLADNSIDFLYCEGVLQHTSDPAGILREFYRIMKPDTTASLMVYNKNSVWIQLCIAYEYQILNNIHPNLTAEAAFSKLTDGGSPMARCWSEEAFTTLCEEAGFPFVKYCGGYFSLEELERFEKFFIKALKDPRLPEKQREYLRALHFDAKGHPLYQGKYAGLGGVYQLHKNS